MLSDRISIPAANRVTHRRTLPWAAALLLGGLVSNSTPQAYAAIFTVGDTAQGCTSPDLDTALFGAVFSSGDDIIRVVLPQANVDLDLINWDPDGPGALTIIGGFTSCADTTPNGRTEIRGNSSGPVFTISATGSATGNDESVVRLEGLDIRNADGFYGVEVSGSGADLELVNSSIRFSDGGLKVSGGADADISIDSALTGNDAGSGQGGGIHCTGTGSSVATSGSMSFNDAATGGGIWVTSGCVVNLRDGAFVFENNATWGGGIALSGTNSTLITSPGPTYPIDISGNIATQQGGGLWVVNSAGAALLDTWIRNNSAGDEGGGVYVDNNAMFGMDRTSGPCTESKCSRLDGNSIDSDGEGSAVFVGGGSVANINQTWIENNTAFEQRGFVLYATDNSTMLNLESVQLFNNNTYALFRSVGNAVIDAGWVSAAFNDYKNFLDIVVSASGATTDTTGLVIIESSILQDHGSFFSQGGGTITATCSYLTTTGGLSGGTSTLVTGLDPGFLDKPRGDLRVYYDSPTVDRCNAFAPTQGDLIGMPRGYDEPNLGFVGDVHDWGAFEAWGMFFADRFENGSTSGWSSASP